MSGIFTFLETVIRFLAVGIRSALSLIFQIPVWAASISSTFAYMPDFILPYVTLSLTVIVILGLIKLIP